MEPPEGDLAKPFTVVEFGPSFFRRLDLANSSQFAEVLLRTAHKDPQLHFNSSLLFSHAANGSAEFNTSTLAGPATDSLISDLAKEVVREANGSNLVMVLDSEHHQVLLEKEEPSELTVEVGIMIALAFFLMALSQVLLVQWRKKHKRSYNAVTTLGLWLFPAIFSVHVQYWRMLAIWTAFSFVSGYVASRSARRPLSRSTPRLVYTWFLSVHRTCFLVGVVGYGLLLSDSFAQPDPEAPRLGLGPLGTVLMFYGLYFGVLGRDLADVCTDFMASRVGFGGRPSRNGPQASNVCGICGQHLRDAEAAAEQLENTVALPCKHRYHEFCIRGWVMVGKKDTCPFCLEKVDLRKLFVSPWQTQSVLWSRLLDAVRYLVVWNPLIVIVCQGLFYVLKMGRKSDPPG
ncbi:Zinc finger RING-type domain containing protein [Klebsormidium nitens]|uniref:Zinc finger RING-type domain containing protein n=1 Tax=Klebsormidium nitens TaxID=105231 RepID=A0A1Y1I4D9_KLENI|nr:Zinc finger RING-type domain containing protein [Klebsormidium nitens]|eukprot:GAQ85804.1 Zinc finger RING-type domain containing protein [Klebsormidium nitens]